MSKLKNSRTTKSQFSERLLSNFFSQKSCDEMNDNPQLVASLTRKGADVNIRTDDSKTLLMIAIWRGSNPEILRLLLAAGADPNLKDKEGQTALMYAAEQENFEVMDLLLKNGADVTLKNKQRHGVRAYIMDNIVFWHQRPFFDLIEKHEKLQQIKTRQRAQEKMQEKALLRKERVTDIINDLDSDLHKEPKR